MLYYLKNCALLLAVLIFATPLVGCRLAGRAITSVQYHNIDYRVVKTVMTMNAGDGALDLRPLMECEVYTGTVTVGRVTAEFPQGFEETARELAAEFDAFYPTVARETGIDWSFDLMLKLVRVPQGVSGFRYSVKLPKSRRLAFPVPVSPDGKGGWWTPLIAHEMTEASLIAPIDRNKIVLDDLYSENFCLRFGTRWFRDGVSNYVMWSFVDPTLNPPDAVFTELNRAKTRLLTWSNCPNEPDLYAAAHGLIQLTVNRFGPDSIPRLMSELAQEEVPGGGGLARAYKRATGEDLKAFLGNYQLAWTGFSVRQTGRPVVTQVYPATPASRRGVRVGDVIVSVAGKPVRDSNDLARALSMQNPGEMTLFEFERDGQALQTRLKLIPMPVDLTQFLKSSEALP